MNESTYQKILHTVRAVPNVYPRAFGIVIKDGKWVRVKENCTICIISACLLGKPVAYNDGFCSSVSHLISQFCDEYQLKRNEAWEFIAGFDGEDYLCAYNKHFYDAGRRMLKELHSVAPSF